MKYVIGVDVGTGSARAGLFDETGHMYATYTHPITLHRPQSEWAEQSSTEIWNAVCQCVRSTLSQTDIKPEKIEGISFSATCSLVLLNKQNEPLTLSAGDDLWDIIVWMDHRATEEAAEVNSDSWDVLANLGGAISPEMQIPKLMWLKRNRPELWEKLGFAGDLADFLTFKSCGSTQRSVCTVGCKWTYNPDLEAWDNTFLSAIGLDDLFVKGQLPEKAVPIGTHLGALTQQSADELGLTTNCQVASGLIDAHAGALGTLGLSSDEDLNRGLALIAGTSNCHIALSSKRCEVPGVWGPYGGAVKNGLWASEGGQSVTGALMDHIVKLFAVARYDYDPHRAVYEDISDKLEEGVDFAGDIHVFPDFLGNRAPFADPDMRGAIAGLTIEDPLQTFYKVYWAAAASIAYGTRLIIDQMNANGFAIDTIHLSGGHKNSDFLVGLYADATGCDVVISEAPEPVLLGAAVAALSQFQVEADAALITERINPTVTIRKPVQASAEMHAKRYSVFAKHYIRTGRAVSQFGAQEDDQKIAQYA